MIERDGFGAGHWKYTNKAGERAAVQYGIRLNRVLVAPCADGNGCQVSCIFDVTDPMGEEDTLIIREEIAESMLNYDGLMCGVIAACCAHASNLITERVTGAWTR